MKRRCFQQLFVASAAALMLAPTAASLPWLLAASFLVCCSGSCSRERPSVSSHTPP